MKRLIIAVLYFLVMVDSVLAATYYVSPTGDDGAAGTTEGTAWKTFNKVNDYAESPGFNTGDSVLFERGATWNSSVCSEDLGHDGSAINWGDNKVITLGGYGTGGSRWIIDGDTRHVYLSDDTGTKYNVSFIINDLEIQGGARATVHDPTAGLVLIALYDVTIDNYYYDGWLNSDGTARVYGLGGARLFNNVTITDSWFLNTTYKPCGTPGCYTGWAGKDNHGIRISFDATDGKSQGAILISGCYFYNHEADSIQLKDYNGYPTTSAHRVTDNYFEIAGENPVDWKSTWGRFDHNDVTSGDIRGGSSGTNGGLSCFHNSAHYGFQPHDLEIDHNYFHDYAGSAVWVNGVDGLNIHHNILHNVISIGEIANSDSVVISDNILVNNTKTTSTYLNPLSWTRFYNGGSATIVNNTFVMPNGGLSYGIHAEDGCDVDLLNNILYTTDADTPLLHWIDNSTGSITYNQYYGTGTLIQYNGTTYTAGNFSTWTAAHSNDALGDPVFVDIANYNAALDATSPCKANSATPAAAYQDLFNLDQTTYNPTEGWNVAIVTETWTGERGAVAYGTSGGGGDSVAPTLVPNSLVPAGQLDSSTESTNVGSTWNEPCNAEWSETSGFTFGTGTAYPSGLSTIQSRPLTGLYPGYAKTFFTLCRDAANNVSDQITNTVVVAPPGNLFTGLTKLNGGIISDSGNWDPSFPVEALTDQVIDYGSNSAGGLISTAWVRYDLGSSTPLGNFIYFGDTEGNWWCGTITVRGSNNLSDWVTLINAASCYTLQPQVVNLGNTEYRYVEVSFVGNTSYGTTGALQVREIELYLGESAPEDPPGDAAINVMYPKKLNSGNMKTVPRTTGNGMKVILH